MRDFAVVPIVVNAGAAVLPTVMAALAGVAAMVLHPKNLVQALRRRPWIATSIAVGLIAGIIFIPRSWRAISKRHGATPARAEAALRIDWTKVAEDILEEEHRRERDGSTPSISAGSVAADGTHSSTLAEGPVAAGMLRQDFSRAFVLGDGSPSVAFDAAARERECNTRWNHGSTRMHTDRFRVTLDAGSFKTGLLF